MSNENQHHNRAASRYSLRPYKVGLTVICCLLLAGCGGAPPAALPAAYACVALPSAGAAAVVDLTSGNEKTLGYVKAGKTAATSVACGGGRVYLANEDNGNIYVYDIGEALANQPSQPLDAAYSIGLKSVVLIDAQISGLVRDKQRGRVYVVSHTSQEGPRFDLLTIIQGTSKLTSLSLPVDVSGECRLQLSDDDARLYIACVNSKRLLTVRLGEELAVISEQPLEANPPYLIGGDGKVEEMGDQLAKLNLPGAKYQASAGSTRYVTYDDGLAVLDGDKVGKLVKIEGKPAGVSIGDQ